MSWGMSKLGGKSLRGVVDVGVGQELELAL